VREKCDEPSPLDTKKRTSLAGGFKVAVREASPGIAMGVGGNPVRV
jgi:hypothetical protein